MQWPAVPRARGLGHTEPGLEVMAPPDQGRRHRDPHEDIPRDWPDSIPRHEAPQSRLRGLRARPLEGILTNRLEALAQLPAQAVEIDEALRQEAIPCLFCWPGYIGQQRHREPGRSPIPAQTEAVNKNQPAELVAPLAGEAGGDAQLRSINSPSQVRTRSWSSGPSGKPVAPWPGRSGATTRCVLTRSGITRPHRAANSPGPCTRSTGAPSPPSSTAEE